jgi:hypothetical protein
MGSMWVQALHATAVDVQRKVAKQHGSSTINFMVYCNGVIFFHKFIDFTGHNQDVQYIFGGNYYSPPLFFVTYSTYCAYGNVHIF